MSFMYRDPPVGRLQDSQTAEAADAGQPFTAQVMLDALRFGDPESCHIKADAILCEHLRSIGHGAVADAFERASKRVGFWHA